MGGGIAPGKSVLHIILPTDRLKVTQGLCLHETILMERVHHACMTPNKENTGCLFICFQTSQAKRLPPGLMNGG